MSAETTPDHSPCCSSHGLNMSCERYRRTHFVEVRPCCATDAARLKGEPQDAAPVAVEAAAPVAVEAAAPTLAAPAVGPTPAPAPRPNIAPGIYEGMSNADYHADPALGSTSLKTLALRTPAHWKYESENSVYKHAYDIGTLAHSLILEGDTSSVAVIDVADKRGNKWTVPAAEAREAGKIPVTAAEWVDIEGMRDSVMAHPIAARMFTGHTAETSVFHDDNGVMVKVRPDARKPGLIGDLKTCADADPNEFGRTAFKLGYFISAAQYTDVWKAATGEEVEFVFVNVEKTAPYLVSVVRLTPEELERGRALIQRAKRIYAECQESGDWYGYKHLATVEMPRWAAYEIEGILENE